VPWAAPEPVGDAGQLVGGQAVALVGDRDPHAVGGRGHRRRDVAAASGVLDRVVQHLVEHAADRLGVDDGRGRRLALPDEQQLAGVGGGPPGAEPVIEQGPHVERLDRAEVLLGPGEREQFLQYALQPLALVA
jgi:hypothetical protein